MTFSVPLSDLLIELLSEANEGLNEAIEASRDQPVIFVAPQIDIQLRCSVIGGRPVEIVPSNASMSNLYRAADDGILNIQLKLTPRRT